MNQRQVAVENVLNTLRVDMQEIAASYGLEEPELDLSAVSTNDLVKELASRFEIEE